MRRYVLRQTVSINGYDFWGRRASVTLEPTGTAGWFWRVGGEDIPLKPSLVHCANRRLVLRHENSEMHVFEHFGALRFMGLDGVRFSGTSWMPYDGRAKMYWRSVRPHIRPDGELKPMRREVSAGVCEDMPIQRHLNAELGTGDELLVSFEVGYPEWGSMRITRALAHDDLVHIFAAKSLARPSWLRPVASVLRWRHCNDVLWANGQPAHAILNELALHGILDLLGAVSTIAPAGEYLTGTISGSRASHALATKFLRQLEPQLR